MVAASTNSPNVGNYFIGKGNVYFTPDGGVERHMGNVPEFVFTPDITTLDHFSSMLGVKSKDLTLILEKKGTLKITLDELTPNNVALAVLGSVDEEAVGGPEVEIFAVSQINGSIRIVGTNDYGARITGTFHNVQFTPSSDLSMITDEFGQIELEGAVLPSSTVGPTFGKFGTLKFTNVVVDTAPDLTAISPSTGAAAGGTAVTLTGTGFIGTTGVTFGGTAATSVVVVSDTSITCVTPAHATGAVGVVVTDSLGSDTLAASFTYT